MIKIIIQIILLSSFAFSQGFTWEKSNREPFEIPITYFGTNFSISNSNYLGSISLFDNDGTYCCEFEDGSSGDLAFGLSGEYWYKPNIAFGINLDLNFLSPSFESRRSLPYFTGDSLILIYELDKQIFGFGISPQVKYRFYDNLNIGFKINLLFNISSSSSARQVALAPEEFFFRNGTKISELENPGTSSFSTLAVIPNLFISYDFQLFYPVYVSPYLSAGYSINSLTEQGLRIFNMNLGFNLYYGRKISLKW